MMFFSDAQESEEIHSDLAPVVRRRGSRFFDWRAEHSTCNQFAQLEGELGAMTAGGMQAY
jgi:hypothetical protein